MNRTHVLLFLATTLAVTGCKPDAALKQGEVIGRGAPPNSNGPSGAVAAEAIKSGVDVTQLGSISGTVHFKGQAPARVPIDMSMDPACTLGKSDNLSEQFVVSNGKLANVYVYVKTGVMPTEAPAGAPSVVLDQKGCRYLPHVIAVQQGGTVEFHNSDPSMHNIHTMPTAAGNASVDISQGPMGAPQSRQFKSPEVMLPVRCNNHPWMNAFINVADSPYFAVSNTDGSFTIRGLPPGTYTLAAVHEKLGEQDFQVTVPAQKSVKADVTFSAR